VIRVTQSGLLGEPYLQSTEVQVLLHQYSDQIECLQVQQTLFCHESSCLANVNPLIQSKSKYTVNMFIRSHYIGITTLDKWRAVAAQTARCRSKVLSMQYVYYFRAYQSQETTSQASFRKHWFIQCK